MEEALIEMCPAGVSVRRMEDITEALRGTEVSAAAIGELQVRRVPLELTYAGEVMSRYAAGFQMFVANRRYRVSRGSLGWWVSASGISRSCF